MRSGAFDYLIKPVFSHRLQASLERFAEEHPARQARELAGDVAGPWTAASTEALRTAQQALGVGVDGKWGPATEDAIQGALAVRQGCSSAGCVTDEGGVAVNGGGVGRLGWLVMGGMAVAGVAVGVALAVRSRSA